MIMRLSEYFRSRRAVSALEYAAIVGIIIVGLGVALNAFKTEISNYMTTQSGKIANLT